MTPLPLEQAVFAEALSRSSPAARAAYLNAACGADAGLRRRVDALLRAAEQAGDFLEDPPTGLMGEAGEPEPLIDELSEKPGDKIGRYKLLEKIGEGGCGVVYMAEQEEPVRRRVALKVIKLGMDTRSVVARFEAERQALALMDHPNIAKVFDGGATLTGRPYFVMELVRGVKITDFCEENAIPTQERLCLFVRVCEAIQHAHQKGVIHRDLKPSNILVTINDGVAVPKVIDFGIAKATGQRLTDKTLFTQFHSFIGTPAYTSPEQAEMSSVDVDTRSDIYSLGVLLYELLTGKTPFDGEELLRSGLDEMRRVIRHEQPPRPSTRLTALAVAADGQRLSGAAGEKGNAAARRLMHLKETVPLVRGDLDWIVMKCLEKDRARRYETANGIAADIKRHLKHEPVTARPPSSLYLLHKLAQRHRGPLVVAGTVFVALVAALLVFAVSNARIRAERNQKDTALRERSIALESARASEQQAREQLFVSLQSQAQARRNSRQAGQRLESLAALSEAARIRPTPELRDSAIAAMAMPDVEHGPVWRAWDSGTKYLAYETRYQRYARMDQDGTLSIRTVPEDRELKRFESLPLSAPGADGLAFKFSPDGRFIAWINKKGEPRIWRWELGTSVLRTAPTNCSAVAFSPDGRRVALSHEGEVTCFDLATGEASGSWQTGRRASQLEFNPDNRTLAVAYQQSDVVSIYEAEAGAHLSDLPIGDSLNTVLAWHPDGNLLAVCGSDPRIQIWNVKTRQKLAVLEGHVQQVNFLMFHWSGHILASASWDGTLRLWQPCPGRMLMRLVPAWMGNSQEGARWVGFISPASQQAQLLGIVPSPEYSTFINNFKEGDSSAFYEGDISPDGTLLALGAEDGVHLWDISRGCEVAWLHAGSTMAVLFRAQGKELVSCGPEAGLQRWGIDALPGPEGGLQIEPPYRIKLPFAPTRIARGRDVRTLAVVGEKSSQCALLDLDTETFRFAGLPHSVAAYISLSPDGEAMASSGWHSEQVKLWNGRTGMLVKPLEVGISARVFFTPDDRELVVARDKEFTFYDRNTQEITRRLPRETGLFPGHVAFTPDGKMMAMEMAPGIIHLKETVSGQTVAKFEDPQGDNSTWLGFTPDGTQLVVAARYTWAVHRWDLRAIRARLKTMNLDWDWPAFPDAPAEASFARNHRQLRVQVLPETPAAALPPSALNSASHSP